MTEYPVLEYTYRMLSDEVMSDTVGLDKVVLERWDRFIWRKASPGSILGFFTVKKEYLPIDTTQTTSRKDLVKGHVNLDTKCNHS